MLLGVGLALVALLTLPIRLLFKRRASRGKARLDRLVVVGLDGLEPTRVERLLAADRLPNLKRLAEKGQYQRLGTTTPPLSPVAWSTFSTGVNPGKHGIFDFIKRGRNYTLELSCSKVMNNRPQWLRRSRSFWSVLGQHGVSSHILRVPVTWPPEKFDGFLLSATGAPDLMGTQGTYTLFALEEPERLQYGRWCPLKEADGGLEGRLEGLEDEVVFLFVGNRVMFQGKKVEIPVEGHSPWTEIRFSRSIGLVKFLRLEGGRYYMTPVQLSPTRPSAPLSHPFNYVVSLGKVLGPFATCGIAEDLGGRNDGVLTLHAFIEQAQSIQVEREAQFFHALKRAPEGLCSVVFDLPDRVQHMTCDEEQLDSLYLQMDQLVGRVMDELAPEDGLMVLSDHGFKPLRFLVDLNAWLEQEGYLVTEGGSINWEKTRAYTLGLCGISLNRQGREDKGCVTPAEAESLILEIAEKLSGLTHGGSAVFREVLPASRAYAGPYSEDAPDLVVGFKVGFAMNKEASRGKVGRCVVVENDLRWVADHGFSAAEVPGVLFSSLSLKEGARLEDLAPTILKLFGVTPPPYIDGRSLWTEMAP